MLDVISIGTGIEALQPTDHRSVGRTACLTSGEKRVAETTGVRVQSSALWLYDFAAFRISWANPAALTLWSAASCEELAARDLRAEMSETVEARLNQYREDFEANPERIFHETWTLYPRDAPVLLNCTFHWCPMPDGRACMLVDGVPCSRPDSETQRAMDALLHSDVLTALYTMDGRELYANRAFRDALGAGEPTFAKLVSDPDLRAAFMDGLGTNGLHNAVVQVATVLGPRWFDARAIRCRDSATGDPAFLVDARDVTAERAYQAELMAARDRALDADRAKSEFVASVSHEMRTPMNGVLGMIELLSHSGLSPEQAKQVQIARQSGMALLALIEDVLDLSSIELKAIRLETDTFDMIDMATNVVEGLRRPAQLKQLTLDLTIGSGVETSATGDPRRLSQLMRNLIGNAIKFTSRGGVTLSVARGSEGALQLEVSDTGPGVPVDQRERIFDKFRQGQSGDVKSGVGLGLAICKEIVALMGGKIGVRDAKDGGACFWVWLPHIFDPASDSPIEHQRES